MKVDARFARAISYLRSAELAPFVEYLQGVRAETLERMVMMTDPMTVARLQGEAQVLKTLLEYVANADALVAKTTRK